MAESRGVRPLGRWRRFLQSMAGSLEMPRDVVLDVPRVTLIGTFQVHVENHKGVLEYTPTRVRIATRGGAFVITGRRLRIGSIFKDEVVVEGRIACIELGPGPDPGGGPPEAEEEG